MSPQKVERAIIDFNKIWLKTTEITVMPKSKEMVSQRAYAAPKPSGCFKFNDGTTQNWTLDQLYDADSKSFKKVVAYFPFVLYNSQNLALVASVDPLLVVDKTVKKCDIYFDSPDLSSNADWQGVAGYSLDVYRMFSSLCGDSEDLYLVQMQVLLFDTTDKKLHTFGEYDGVDYVFHPIKQLTPYHFIWKPPVLSDPKYIVKKLRIRITMPGYLGLGGGECAPRGKWLIGNVCPEK
jgi:hypothetical protein